MCDTTENTYKKCNKKQLEFIEVYKNNGCFVASSCRKFGIERSTFYTWFKENKDFRERIEICNEELKDFAESKLWSAIKGGDTTAIIFYHKTKMKDRGYIERQEIEHSGKMEIDTKDISKLSDEELRELAK